MSLSKINEINKANTLKKVHHCGTFFLYKNAWIKAFQFSDKKKSILVYRINLGIFFVDKSNKYIEKFKVITHNRFRS